VAFWAVPAGKDIKNFVKANSKKCVGIEVLLVTQEMKFDKKLIGSAFV
jgi:hypothetical protein